MLSDTLKCQLQHHIAHCIFRLQFRKSFSNTLSHLNITINSASAKQCPCAATRGLHGIALIIFSASYRWSAGPRRLTMQVKCSHLQKSCKLWSVNHNSACLHPPNLHRYKLTEFKQKWYHLAVHLQHIWSKCLTASLPCPCILQVQHSHQVMASHWALLKQPLWEHFAYMPTKLFPAELIDEWYAHEHTWPLHLQICLQMHSAPPQSGRLRAHNSCFISWNSSSAFWPSPNFTCPHTMAFQVTT